MKYVFYIKKLITNCFLSEYYNKNSKYISAELFKRYFLFITIITFILLKTLSYSSIFLSITSSALAKNGVMLSAETNRPRTSTFSFGEAVKIDFSVTGLRPESGAELVVDIFDEESNAISKIGPVPLKATRLGAASHSISLPASRLGYYEVRAHLSDGTTLNRLGTRPAGIVSYAVVPDPSERSTFPASKSRFGLQGGFNSKAVVLPYLGARWLIRGGGFDWASLEAGAPRQFFAESRAFSQIGDGTYPLMFRGKRWETYFIPTVTRASLPAWALKSGTSGSKNKNFGALNEQGMREISRFAFEFSKRFAKDHQNQDIRYYQVTWEPNNGWGFGGTPNELVELYHLVYGAIHDADPQASVAGPTIHLYPSSTKQLRFLWKAGLAQYIDSFSVHPYSKWPPEANQLPAALRKQLRDAKTITGHDIPFLGTEHGFRSLDVGLLQKAQGDIRSTVILLGEGASLAVGFYVHDFWFRKAPTDVSSHGFYWNLNSHRGFGSDKLGPKPIVPAYAAMTLFLDGTVSDGPIENLTGTQMGYKFSGNGVDIAVVWDHASTSEYSVLEGQTVCDWMGNCEVARSNSSRLVNGSPIYVIKR